MQYEKGHFAGLAPRDDDPPMYESEASYLDRHGILTDAERPALEPDAFKPVSYTEIDEPFIDELDGIDDENNA